MVPAGEIDMGHAKYERFTRCPWGTTLYAEGTVVADLLRTHWAAKHYPQMVTQATWRDPRVLEAFAVLDAEEAACTLEMREKP